MQKGSHGASDGWKQENANTIGGSHRRTEQARESGWQKEQEPLHTQPTGEHGVQSRVSAVWSCLGLKRSWDQPGKAPFHSWKMLEIDYKLSRRGQLGQWTEELSARWKLKGKDGRTEPQRTRPCIKNDRRGSSGAVPWENLSWPVPLPNEQRLISNKNEQQKKDGGWISYKRIASKKKKKKNLSTCHQPDRFLSSLFHHSDNTSPAFS